MAVLSTIHAGIMSIYILKQRLSATSFNSNVTYMSKHVKDGVSDAGSQFYLICIKKGVEADGGQSVWSQANLLSGLLHVHDLV